MIALALLLGMFGIADLIRSRDSELRRPVVIRSLVAGTALLAVSLWGTGLPAWWFFVGLALTIVALLATNSWQPQAQGWLVDWYSSVGLSVLDGLTFERFALATASFAFVTESANSIVRMIISGSNDSMISNEKSLKGGRTLRPIERIFILAMGLGGEFLPVAAVVAAKASCGSRKYQATTRAPRLSMCS